MATKETSTRNVAFRFENEDFQIQLETTSKDGKVVSVSDSTQKIFDYLKSLHLVPTSEEITSWLNSSNTITISIISGSKDSFKIRKKAMFFGLEVIPGVSFQKRREESLKKAFQTNRCFQHTATN